MHRADCNATCNQKITPGNHPLCVRVCVDVGVCVHFKESDNPPPLSLARYLGIRTARKWQSTVREQVLLGLRCVTEQTLPHQTGCLFCTLPLSSVTHHPNHTRSHRLVIWSSEWGSLSAVMACACAPVCVFQAGCSSYMLLSCFFLSSPHSLLFFFRERD